MSRAIKNTKVFHVEQFSIRDDLDSGDTLSERGMLRPSRLGKAVYGCSPERKLIFLSPL
jgi:hypothetical protein